LGHTDRTDAWRRCSSRSSRFRSSLAASATGGNGSGHRQPWRKNSADQLALERRARLYGWSGHGIDTFGVTLVTTPEELDRASIELGGYADYVILRVSEHEHGANGNRAQSLRQIIEHQGYIARSPTPGEREALEAGIGAMGIPQRG
jgi:hypothetical protein